MPKVIESFQEFCQRHHGNPVRIGPVQIYLPSGAVVHDVVGGVPMLNEPPADLGARLSNQKQYAEERLRRAEADFHHLRAALKGESLDQMLPARFTWPESEYGDSPPDGIVALRKLKSVVLERRQALKDIESEIAALPESVARREATEAETRRHAEQQVHDFGIQMEIAKIEI